MNARNWAEECSIEIKKIWLVTSVSHADIPHLCFTAYVIPHSCSKVIRIHLNTLLLKTKIDLHISLLMMKKMAMY